MAHLFLRFQAPHGRLGPGLRLELTKGFCQVFCGTRVTHASNKPPFVKLTWFPRNICHGLLTMFTSQSFGFTPLGGGRPCQRLARPRPCLTCPSQRDRRLVRRPLKSNKSTKRRSQRRWGSSSLNVDPNMAGSAHQAASSRLIADHTHRLPVGNQCLFALHHRCAGFANGAPQHVIGLHAKPGRTTRPAGPGKTTEARFGRDKARHVIPALLTKNK